MTPQKSKNFILKKGFLLFFMVGKSQSYSAKPKAVTLVMPKMVARKLTRKEETNAVKELKKIQKEQANYQKGLARRAAEDAKAKEEEEQARLLAAAKFAKRRARMYDNVRRIQQMLHSMMNPMTRVWYASNLPYRVQFPATEITCPSCEHQLTETDVARGFSSDPLDFETTCPKCKTRFAAVSTISYWKQRQRIVWLCPAQTREAYAEWLLRPANPDKTFETLCRECPEIAWNAYRYGLQDGYDNKKNMDAKTVIMEFLATE